MHSSLEGSLSACPVARRKAFLSRASHQSPGGGGEAIIWNTTKEVLKWSPHSREVVYFLNVCLHKFSQNMSPWIYHFSLGWKDRQIQVVLIFLSEKDHSLGIVEAISITWWWVSNQRMSGVTPELGEQWCTRNLFLCTKGVSKCQWPPSVGAMGCSNHASLATRGSQSPDVLEVCTLLFSSQICKELCSAYDTCLLCSFSLKL